MDEEMDLMDEQMPTMATTLTEWKPLWTPACLTEKLQKLKDTPKQISDEIDCKSDNLKKRSQSTDTKPLESSPKQTKYEQKYSAWN